MQVFQPIEVPETKINPFETQPQFYTINQTESDCKLEETYEENSYKMGANMTEDEGFSKSVQFNN